MMESSPAPEDVDQVGSFCTLRLIRKADGSEIQRYPIDGEMFTFGRSVSLSFGSRVRVTDRTADERELKRTVELTLCCRFVSVSAGMSPTTYVSTSHG